MKEFSLEEYLKNPDREVVTRAGRKVRIICTDRKNHDSHPIIALVETDEDDERVRSFKIDGKWSIDGLENYLDLFFAPEKHERWINLYKDNDNIYASMDTFETKEDAEALSCSACIATVKVEWEE